LLDSLLQEIVKSSSKLRKQLVTEAEMGGD